MLCRWAKPLGEASRTHGPCSVYANQATSVTLTFHAAHRSNRNRALSLTLPRGNPVAGHEHDVRVKVTRDSACGFTSRWRHWDRIAASESAQSAGGRGHLLPPRTGHGLHALWKGVVGDVCFAGVLGRCCPGTMQTRASSTAAAAKQREADAEQHKADEQALKHASPAENDSGSPEPAPAGGKPNKTQQLKKVFKEYGAVGVSFHICISLMSLGMFYLLVSSGIDMGALLCKLGFSETVVKSKMAAGTSTFVLAYAVHKLFAPVRISITLVSVPLIVRHFRKIGLFKAPPTAP